MALALSLTSCKSIYLESEDYLLRARDRAPITCPDEREQLICEHALGNGQSSPAACPSIEECEHAAEFVEYARERAREELERRQRARYDTL